MEIFPVFALKSQGDRFASDCHHHYFIRLWLDQRQSDRRGIDFRRQRSTAPSDGCHPEQFCIRKLLPLFAQRFRQLSRQAADEIRGETGFDPMSLEIATAEWADLLQSAQGNS